MEKIEISDDSYNEEIKKPKKKKKKSKKKKKNKDQDKEGGESTKINTSREDINPDVANIEITQNDESDGCNKKSRKKKKKKDKSKKDKYEITY